jgi:hypothetical protein
MRASPRRIHLSYSPVCSSFIWMLFFNSVVDVIVTRRARA